MKDECPWRGWSAVWANHPQWADAYGLRFERSLQPLAQAFDPVSLHAPDPSWDEFSRTVAALSRTVVSDEGGRAMTSLLATVAGPQWLRRRSRILSALRRPGAQLAAIKDLDLLGYASDTPGWLPLRIGCVVAAMEIALAQQRRPIGSGASMLWNRIELAGLAIPVWVPP